MADFRQIAVVGAGRMGHGLAQMFAMKGLHVTLISTRESTLQSAKKQIIENLRIIKREFHSDLSPDNIAGSIVYTNDPSSGLVGSDFVLETISEDLDAKTKVFRVMDEVTPEGAVLASNTSGLSITRLSEATQNADRVLGCHWWNPPYLMPLVEIIPGQHTSIETVARTERFIKGLGKDTVLVKKEVPGFIWNRIQAAVVREAMHLLDEGVASPEDIDKVVRRGYALRSSVMGPFKTIDLSGLELWKTVCENLFPHLSDSKSPSKTFDEKMKDGHLGAEQGSGFYQYEKKSYNEVLAERDVSLISLLKSMGVGVL